MNIMHVKSVKYELHSRHFARFAAALSLVWCCTSLFAQPAAEGGTSLFDAPAEQLPEQRIQLDFRDVPLDTILQYLSEQAGLVVVRSVAIDGRVTVMSRQPMTIPEAVSVLSTTLRDKGYAAVLADRTLKIVPLANARQESVTVRAGADPGVMPGGDLIVTQVIPIRYADATQIKDNIAPLLPEFANVSANQRSNSLIVTDTAANVRRIAQIVIALDKSIATSVDVKVFTLQYAEARTVAQLVNQLFREDEATRRLQQQQRVTIQRFQRMGGNAGGDAPSVQPQVEVKASADERTNTVVVTGPPDTLEVVARVVNELDSNPAASQTVFVYSIRNGKAAQVATVLNSLINTTGGNRGASQQRNTNTTNRNNTNRSNTNTNRSNTSNRRSDAGDTGGDVALASLNAQVDQTEEVDEQTDQQRTAPTTTAPPEEGADLGGQVSIVADEDTNSLIILTPSRNVEEIRKILDSLDRPVPQVVIKVLIAEVTHDNDRELGVEFSTINPKDSGKTSLFTDFGLAAATPSGLMFRLLETDVQATLKALDREGKVNVLSRPYILTSDNQEASITIGTEVPFIRRSRTTESGQTINDIEYEDIGIILTVRPNINPDGLVTMDISPEISAITDSSIQISEAVTAPIFSKRSANSRVAVRDGQTIVIGGLMEDRMDKTVRKVPILGDVPLLGLLFKSTTESKVKTELLIFLTPHVATLPDVLRKRSQQELDGSTALESAISPGAMQDHLNQMAPPDGSEPALTVPRHDTGDAEQSKPAARKSNGRSGPQWSPGN